MEAVQQIPSFQEQLNDLRLGGYRPDVSLSRALAARFVEKSRQIDRELTSWQPCSLSGHPTAPREIDSS
jgi:hypothetical protein